MQAVVCFHMAFRSWTVFTVAKEQRERGQGEGRREDDRNREEEISAHANEGVDYLLNGARHNATQHWHGMHIDHWANC